MAKAKKQIDDNGTPAKVYKLTGGIVDKLKGAGYSVLWTAKPKGQLFVIGAMISPERRIVVVQQYSGGRSQLFEEVTEAQLFDTAYLDK